MRYFLVIHCLLFLNNLHPSWSSWRQPSTDLTLVEKAVGQDVVFATIHKIQTSQIFPPDYDLLARIAYVESLLGESVDTFPPNFFGGIWQIHETNYEATKDISLTHLHEKIWIHFRINWTSTVWSDLLKPMYSGLAAILQTSLIEQSIPQALTGQANYWKLHFSDEPQDSEKEFVAKVTEWEGTFFCKGEMDLLTLMDESGSIDTADFQLELKFVADLLATYPLQSVRQGLMTFSGYSRKIFGIDNEMTAEEIRKTVLSVTMTAGGTNTTRALLDAVEHFKTVRERPGVPRIVILFTDGHSGSGVTAGVTALANFDITSFAIGAGDFLYSELLEIALGNPAHVFQLTGFTGLENIIHQLNKATCALPQKLRHNVTTANGVEGRDSRIYYFDMPEGRNITVLLTVEEGNVENFYSHTYSAPSSALYDGKVELNNDTYVVSNPSKSFWILVMGLEKVNRYSLLVTADEDPEAPPTTTTETTTIETTTSKPRPVYCNLDDEQYADYETVLTPVVTDCKLYLNCTRNEANDFFGTIQKCGLGTVFCPREVACTYEGVCPCLFP